MPAALVHLLKGSAKHIAAATDFVQVEKDINKRPSLLMCEVDDSFKIDKELTTCSKNLQKYEKGDSLAAWKQDFYNTVTMFGRHLRQSHLVELARKGMGTSVNVQLILSSGKDGF